MRINQIFILFIIGNCVHQIKAQDSDGTDDNKEKSLFRNLVKPFRMEKLNLIWIKAQQVHIYVYTIMCPPTPAQFHFMFC